jgi:CRP-like cAMP-binding protein
MSRAERPRLSSARLLRTLTGERRPDVPIELGAVERMLALRSFPGATRIEAPALAVLSSIAEARRYPAGAAIVRRGARLTHALVTVEGEMIVHDGAERRIAAPRALGIAHLFAHEPCTFGCVAAADSIALRIHLEDLEDVFEDFPSVLVRVVRDLASRALAQEPSSRPLVAAAGTLVPARPLDFVERILALRKLQAIGGGSIDAVAGLARSAREIRLGPGEFLWAEDEEATSMAYLLEGRVRELRGDVETLHEAGTLVGELDCMAGGRRASRVVADAPLVAIVLDRDAVPDVWEDHIDAALAFLAALGARLLHADW